MNKTPLLLLLVVLFSSDLLAQPSYSFIHISRKDGLASEDVYDIVQDEKGFYWVATDNGLQRYDGKRWVHPVNSDRSIPARPVHQLVWMGNSQLMVKMGNAYGIFTTSDFTFRYINVSHTFPTKSESELWQDSKGRIALIFRGAGILYFDAAKNEFNNSNAFLRLPPGMIPNSIFEDKQKGHYWISGKPSLAVFDSNNGNVYSGNQNPLQLPFVGDSALGTVTSVYIDHERNHWIVYGNSDRQFFRAFNEKTKQFIPEAEKLHNFYDGKFSISRLYQTAEEEMWLYGKSALFNYIPEQARFSNNKSDVSRNIGARFSEVRRIMQDREKGIWIATDEGLYQFYTVLPEVRNVIFKTDNADYSITGALGFNNGELWLSSKSKGIIAMDSNQRKVDAAYAFANVAGNVEWYLRNALTIQHQVSTGKVWLGCVEGYLLVIDRENKQRRILHFDEIGNHDIIDIKEDGAGAMWIGTAAGEVFRMTSDIATPQKMIRTEGAVNRLLIDNSNVWVATSEAGLLRYDIAARRIIQQIKKDQTTTPSLSSNDITGIVRLNDSLYAVSTDILQILNVRSNTVEEITYENGLLGNSILGMQVDKQGHLWLGTSNGICRYNVKRRRFTAYGEKDGFMRYGRVGTATTALPDGRIVFAGSNNFVIFPPNLMIRQEAPPPVLFTDIKVLDRFVPVDSAMRKLVLSHDNNTLSFYFSAMTYLNKDKLTFYYRMKDIEKEWRMADNQLAATYTLLPSGNYVFETMCENEDGIRSPVTSLAFSINPPFWKTWWFILLICLIVAAVLFTLHRMKVKRILALSDLRNRVARDLHDDVGSTLSTISILSTIAKGKLEDNPVQAEQYISKITDNSQQMMDAMDDIVWSIKPMNDSMQKIVARMREFASGALEPKNIDIDFYVDDRVPDLKLDMEARRDLFLIFKEAINNTAKYSHATNVTIHISYIKQRLLLRIKDNGEGFDINQADSGNGLSNMKKRAAMLKGRIRWYSEPGRGTNVLLNIPVNS